MKALQRLTYVVGNGQMVFGRKTFVRWSAPYKWPKLSKNRCNHYLKRLLNSL
jgi:hypothetical protein